MIVIGKDYNWYRPYIYDKYTIKNIMFYNENGVIAQSNSGWLENNGKDLEQITINVDEIALKRKEDFKMISAKEYFKLSEKDYEDKYKLKNKDEELYKIVQKQIEFIDNNFELLTDEEYKEIFNTEYEYKNCIKPKDLEELQKEIKND